MGSLQGSFLGFAHRQSPSTFSSLILLPWISGWLLHHGSIYLTTSPSPCSRRRLDSPSYPSRLLIVTLPYFGVTVSGVVCGHVGAPRFFSFCAYVGTLLHPTAYEIRRYFYILTFMMEYNDFGASLPPIELIVGSVGSPLACSLRSTARSFGRESPVSVRYDHPALDATVCTFVRDFTFPAPVSVSSLS